MEERGYMLKEFTQAKGHINDLSKSPIRFAGHQQMERRYAMKTLRTCGWAVIFIVTLFLTAFVSFDAEAAANTSMSDPDTAITQLEETEIRMIEDTEPGAYQYAVMGGQCYARLLNPATYRSVAVIKPVELPEGEPVKPILYQIVTEKVKVADEHMNWEEVLCDSSVTESTVSDIQRALADAGFDPGPINGLAGEQTIAALNVFQTVKGLTVTNYLTVETVESLGLEY
jgi:hypothetical protein